ncbi:hypothetical protein M9Y10_028284 [Tritrichomonas musculus]|uniref:FHA domain-containing protein n=1 Tax=Tritrichomonas musculus TaxID=1915356 RepID=A0ABR2KJ35_9EUKA
MTSALHIIVQYVRLKGGIVKPKDELRIGLTSMPNHGKDRITISASNLGQINHEFVLNCSVHTQEILFIVRRKSYINGDPILGGTKMKLSSFPHDKLLEKVLYLEEILTVNNGSNIRKISGTMGIKAFFVEDPINNSSFSTATPPQQPSPHFQAASHFAQSPQTYTGNSQPQGAQESMGQPQPHHTRRKSLMPKWKKHNKEYACFDDPNAFQPLLSRDLLVSQEHI